jgi:hypothetical protein
MGITHDRITLNSPDEPVMFASLLDISCSICAPATMTENQIEAYANKHYPTTGELGPWKVVDVFLITKHGHSPNPCNQVDGRTHWFLLSELLSTTGLEK